jgi:hypothetical protein
MDHASGAESVPQLGLSTGVVIVEAAATPDPVTSPGPGMCGDAIRQLKDQLDQDLCAKKETDLRAKEEADLQARQEADRTAKEADRRAKEEADQTAKLEADQRVKQEAEAKEADRKAKEADLKVKQEVDLGTKKQIKQEVDVPEKEKQLVKAEPRMVESRPVFRVTGRPVAVERQPRGPGQGPGFQARPAGGRLDPVQEKQDKPDKVGRFQPSAVVTQVCSLINSF